MIIRRPARQQAGGAGRQDLLRQSARQAGLGNVRLIPEPAAAATTFATTMARRLQPGAVALVYDLGAGTFDASVMRYGDDGFTVQASHGLPDVGGLDIDAAVITHLATVYTPHDASLWQRLRHPQDPADLRISRRLWADIRDAKELLTNTSSAFVSIPLLDLEAPIGREELERLASPILQRTITASNTLLVDAGVTPSTLAGIFLVGGSSRIPLVNTMLHRAFGVPPTVVEQPELAVAEGALLITGPDPQPPPAPHPDPGPIETDTQHAPTGTTRNTETPSAATVDPPRPPAPTSGRLSPIGRAFPRRTRTTQLLVAAVAVLILLSTTLLIVLNQQGTDPGPTFALGGNATTPATTSTTANPSGSASPATTKTPSPSTATRTATKPSTAAALRDPIFRACRVTGLLGEVSAC